MRAISLRRFGLVLSVFAISLFFAGSTYAGEEANEREIQRAKEKIHHLLRQAEELEELGKLKEAKQAARQAQALKKKLHARLHGGEERADAKRLAKIVKGLVNGIEALHALGGHDEMVVHLKHIVADLKAKHRKAGKRREREEPSERQLVQHWIELMHMAHDVLREARRHEAAELIEHGVHALELALAGRKDDEAKRVRRTAPKRAAQAKALFLAAEILADQGHEKRARRLAELGHRFKGQKKERREEEGEDEDEDEERAALKKRVEILRLAMPALREGERRDAAEMLERAIHVVARKAYAAVPKLGQLAEILSLAARLWMRFENADKAEAVAGLSRYYAERSREAGREREREHGEGREREEKREHAERRERAEQIEQLRHQMRELEEMLERMRRHLKTLARVR